MRREFPPIPGKFQLLCETLLLMVQKQLNLRRQRLLIFNDLHGSTGSENEGFRGGIEAIYRVSQDEKRDMCPISNLYTRLIRNQTRNTPIIKIIIISVH